MSHASVGHHGDKAVCVFAGAARGFGASYGDTAATVGALVAAERATLVCGGMRDGLLGEVIGAALETGGHVVGLVPTFLDTPELVHPRLSQKIVVESVNARKSEMVAASDGFLVLPGGFGTLEELCDVLSWADLGLHTKPVGLINVNGYFDYFAAFIGHALSEGFISPRAERQIECHPDPRIVVAHVLDGAPVTDNIGVMRLSEDH
jgi:uncharacterized protein (TIGR00730 family)